MSITTLELTAHDPIIARDGRPFGAGQGNRMRGLSWPLPSVVAGSCRSALVKANPPFDFTVKTPLELMRVEVAGPLPMVDDQLYFPAPADCVWDEHSGRLYRAAPTPLGEGEGVDFPVAGLQPVRLSLDQADEDFKPLNPPPWWPVGKMVEWLTTDNRQRDAGWFDQSFLADPVQTDRDHVCLDPQTGAAAEGLIFTTSNLHVSHLPRFGVAASAPFRERFAETRLSVRLTIAETMLPHVERLRSWYPMGGERRLVHWRPAERAEAWSCPEVVRTALAEAKRARMALVTPAIFAQGWLPAWLDRQTLEGKPLGDGPRLRLVGACVGRWRAVSGWAYAPHANSDGGRPVVPKDRPGPKAIRRMVPAGSVYFFEVVDGDPRILATNGWLKPLSDAPHDRRDGFGLAVWGTW